MPVLRSTIDARAPAFVRNADVLKRLVDDLHGKLHAVRQGGSEEAKKRHVARGKLVARERIRRLIDPDTALLELSPLAAYEMYGGDVPSASIITRIGRICRRDCVIVAHDPTLPRPTSHP